MGLQVVYEPKKKKKKTVVYKDADDKIRDKIVDYYGGKKTTSYVSYGKKAGPKGFQRKVKAVEKRTPAGKKSTVISGSKKVAKELGPDYTTGKGARQIMKDAKHRATSVTMNGRTYKTKNRIANPNLRKKYGY